MLALESPEPLHLEDVLGECGPRDQGRPGDHITLASVVEPIEQPAPQSAEAQPPAGAPEQRESPAGCSRSEQLLPWAQMGFSALCVGTGTVAAVAGNPGLGTVIAAGGGINLNP
ncbi:hypothetical protein [Streptomyces ochraceiscleroticus]|uniref:Uncharacterized protein n=1 Tax=Streptomyces ochraceiscleroticus TaxID=47761 RepID=A0ABW1MKM6_9ACTN|nr:hypothetical protein [Streptomyces ochraceiscleroticus]